VAIHEAAPFPETSKQTERLAWIATGLKALAMTELGFLIPGLTLPLLGLRAEAIPKAAWIATVLCASQ
jgi:hypothetical protein